MDISFTSLTCLCLYLVLLNFARLLFTLTILHFTLLYFIITLFIRILIYPNIRLLYFVLIITSIYLFWNVTSLISSPLNQETLIFCYDHSESFRHKPQLTYVHWLSETPRIWKKKNSGRANRCKKGHRNRMMHNLNFISLYTSIQEEKKKVYKMYKVRIQY